MKQYLLALFAILLLLSNAVFLFLPQNAEADSEVVTLRTENSKTYSLSNGSYRLVAYDGAIHYKDNYSNQNEIWKDINLTFTNGIISKAPYIFQINSDGSATITNKKTGAVTTVSLLQIGNSSIAKPSLSYVNNKALAYNISTDTDLEIVATNRGIQYTRVLKSNKASLDAKFAVSSIGSGITIETRATDSKTRLDTIPVTKSLVGGILTETIDTNITKDLTYPVRIDPIVYVAASLDDSYCEGNDDTQAPTNAIVNIRGGTGDVDYTRSGGIRFALSIPAGAIINTCTVNLYTYTVIPGDDPQLDIYGHASDNSPEFSGANNIVWGRPRTTATVSWAATDIGVGAYKASPGISAVLQEVVNRAGWVYGNYFTVLLIGKTAAAPPHALFVNSYDNGSNYPYLDIAYTGPGPTVTTQAGSSIEATTATGNGNITSTGSSAVTERGICYSSVNNPPTTADSTVHEHSAGFSTGAYTESLTSLSTGTTYYLRAYAINTEGTGYGSTVTILTKPAAPTGVTASDGTFSTKVKIDWTKSTGATDYHVWRDAVDLGAAGDVATFDDTGAGNPTINAGTVTASDGTSATHVVLTNAGALASNGATHTYKVVASNATGNSADSSTNTGYKGTTTLTYQWQRSAADSDATYSNIGGGTTNPYNDTGAPSNGDGRYFKVTVSMSGASDATTAADRGYRAVAPTVVTGLCTGFGTTTAVLNGNITATGSPTTITGRGFDYGLDTSYGSSSTTTGTYSTGAFMGTLSNLSPGTVYHYRAKAQNASGWGYGADAVFATKGSPTPYITFNTGDDGQFNIYGVNFGAQTFTTPAGNAKTITSVNLKLLRVLSPGTITVQIKHTAAGVPTGDVLCSGTINGNIIDTSAAWYQVAMTTETSLEPSTIYSIIVSAASGDAANYVRWRYVTAGGYASGTADTSVNSGTSWSVQTYDFMFEVWGNVAMEIQDAKVFSSYASANDWLITVRYKNVYPPYYDTYDVKKYFSVQLLDTTGSTVIAQTQIPAWGNRVASIYLSPTLAGTLTWGSAYYIRIYGNFSGNPVTDYVLVGSDWIGSDLTNLDSWIITSSGVISTYYSNRALTTYVTGRGEVLNADGATIFSEGIAGLAKYRPSIFLTSSASNVPAANNPTQAEREKLKPWQPGIGPDGVDDLTRWANTMSLDGGTMLSILFIILALGIAAFCFPAGHATAANFLPIPIIAAGVYFGIDLIYIGILVLIGAWIFVKAYWIDR